MSFTPDNPRAGSMEQEVEFVEMVHPDVGDSAQATREAFEQVWKARGWELKGPQPQQVANPETGTASPRPGTTPVSAAPRVPQPSEEVK